MRDFNHLRLKSLNYFFQGYEKDKEVINLCNLQSNFPFQSAYFVPSCSFTTSGYAPIWLLKKKSLPTSFNSSFFKICIFVLIMIILGSFKRHLLDAIRQLKCVIKILIHYIPTLNSISFMFLFLLNMVDLSVCLFVSNVLEPSLSHVYYNVKFYCLKQKIC